MKYKAFTLGVAILSLIVVSSTLPARGQDSEKTREGPVLAQRASGVKNPTCLDNYLSWNNSTTYKTTSSWNTAFMTSSVIATLASAGSNSLNPINQLQDINGDGLPDYVYLQKANDFTGQNQAASEASCVYLNNGNGWTLTYRCVADPTSGKFYGDCAG